LQEWRRRNKWKGDLGREERSRVRKIRRNSTGDQKNEATE
jgi:hypothetical protein